MSSTESAESAIEVEGLYKIFGRRAERGVSALVAGSDRSALAKQHLTAAVIDAEFAVRSGEIFVVMGLSGSGKSTLIRMLNGLLTPTAGEVRVAGAPLTRLKGAHLRKLRQEKISMVFQHFALLPHRTVADNVAFGLAIAGAPVEERRERTVEAVEMVGLKGWESKLPSQLSGGMQQRVGLARALAAGTEIMLMDEAFSALDPLIRREMQDQLLELQQRLGKTVVFITHDLNEAMRLGDRIAVMRDGRIVQIGSAEEILAHPADDYVAEFIADVDRTRVLTAASVMQPPPRGVSVKPESEFTVDEDTPVADLFARYGESRLPLQVTDADGRVVGVVPKLSLIDALGEFGGEVESPSASDRNDSSDEPREASS